MSLYEAAKDLHDYLWANVPDILDISTSSELAGEGIKKRLQALKDALKNVDGTDMPLPLIARELRSIASELADSDLDAWKSNISMLQDIAGDLEARSDLPFGPYSVGDPEDEDGVSTVLNVHFEPMTADEIVRALNEWRELAFRASEQGAGVIPTVAIQHIAAERQRQVEREGWSTEHDDEHPAGSLALAGMCYAQHGAGQLGKPYSPVRGTPAFWPWESQWWKPKNARYDLVRAAALIAAEIERMDRASMKVNREA